MWTTIKALQILPLIPESDRISTIQLQPTASLIDQSRDHCHCVSLRFCSTYLRSVLLFYYPGNHHVPETTAHHC